MSDFHRRRFRRLPRPPISRRSFLRRAGGAAIGVTALAACQGGRDGVLGHEGPSGPVTVPDELSFLHGVASGDPREDRVILWTRVTPADPDSAGLIAVDWLLASDPELSQTVRSGRFVTSAERDFTVKVDPTLLQSFTTYYYQFAVTLSDGSVLRSPVGRTKTAPSRGDAVEQLRIASAACNSWTFGFFNAFGRIAERADLDLVIHLGDYIYEGGGGQLRSHDPAYEIVSLSDYRRRHAQYKTDPDLQEAHRQHPWITTWDDHETTNNSYATGASNHSEGADAEGFWTERMGWALRAYFEWMPIRDNGPGFDAPAAGEPRLEAGATGLSPNGLGRIYRRIPYGSLVDIIMLDTRLSGRTEQSAEDIFGPEQTILGAEQREWFLNELAASTATWKIIGNGTTFAPLIAPVTNPLTQCTSLPGEDPCYVNEDAWDGYRFDRQAVYDVLEGQNIQNSVFIFGDIHAVIACDLPRDPNDPASYNPLTGEGSLGVELCCGGVAQVPVPVWTGLMASGSNPHMKHAQEEQLGYMLMDITPERVQGKWYYSIAQLPSVVETLDPVMLQSLSGSQRLTPALLPSSEKQDPPPLAP